VRPTGFFETNPNVDASTTSPRARFNFSGVCSPTQFRPRAALAGEGEAALGAVLAKLRGEARDHALDVASFMRPFDKSHKGAVTRARFVRQLCTQFRKITASEAELLCTAFAAPDDCVNFALLDKEVAPHLVPEGTAAGGVPRLPPGGVPRSLSPNTRRLQEMGAGASAEEVKDGFRVILRTLHERRIRIGDVIRDFGHVSPFPGRITKEQLVRSLASIGGPVSALDPRVVEAVAGTYALSSDPAWVDATACIRDLEATSYLRHLETFDPGMPNATFSREVAQSPNPRFITPRLSSEEEQALKALLATLKDRVAKRRVFNVRLFANQFDVTKEGFLTVDRFMRVLSTLDILPAKKSDQDLLVHHYNRSRGVDYKSFLSDLDMS
jgi:hypothetical protein